MLEAVPHRSIRAVPAVVFADPGSPGDVGQRLPADIVGGRADLLPTYDHMGALLPLVAALAEQRDGLIMQLDLLAGEAHRQQGPTSRIRLRLKSAGIRSRGRPGGASGRAELEPCVELLRAGGSGDHPIKLVTSRLCRAAPGGTVPLAVGGPG